jgi:hypothetical protein
VVFWSCTSISEKHATSIYRVGRLRITGKILDDAVSARSYRTSTVHLRRNLRYLIREDNEQGDDPPPPNFADTPLSLSVQKLNDSKHILPLIHPNSCTTRELSMLMK